MYTYTDKCVYSEIVPTLPAQVASVGTWKKYLWTLFFVNSNNGTEKLLLFLSDNLGGRGRKGRRDVGKGREKRKRGEREGGRVNQEGMG